MARKRAAKKINRRKPSLVSRIIFVVNLMFSLLLLLSYLAPHVSPEWTTIPAFLGLAYPVLALINMLFMIFWLLLLRKYFLVPALCLILGFPLASRHIQFNSTKAVNEAQKGIRVMSYNVRMFDFFDWKKDEQSVQDILEVIREESPDILCIQEFYNNPGEGGRILKMILEAGEFSNPHLHYDAERRGHAFGSATFSRYPVINKGSIDLPGMNPYHALYTDIDAGIDTFRVYNLHLVSYRFAQDDYDFFKKLREGQETADFKTSSKKMLTKLQRGFVIRARQARVIRGHMEDSPYPVILCGDFNDTPASFAYRHLSKGYADAFMESGRGTGQTYTGILPSFRIDYILHDKKFTSRDYKTISGGGSDHQPISCFITKEEE